jgi:acyl carrier protein
MEEKLRELLIPVFGLSTIDEIQLGHSLVNDLGATSIDFVEISYIIESNFGVTIKTNELMIGGTTVNPDEVFIDGILTAEGADMLNKNTLGKTFSEGQTRRELYESITVADLVQIIKMKQTNPN